MNDHQKSVRSNAARDVVDNLVRVAPMHWSTALEMQDAHRSRKRYWFSKLIAPNDPQSTQIRKWIKRNARPNVSWIKELKDIAHQFAIEDRVSSWDKAEARARRRHAAKIARLARQLAETMQADVSPHYPSPWDLMDEGVLSKIIATLSTPIPSPTPGLSWVAPVKPLSDDEILRAHAVFHHPGVQTLPPMLERLADFADQAASERRIPKYKSKTTGEVKAFEDRLHRHLSKTFDPLPSLWPTFIADCVQFHSGLDSRDDQAVRDRQRRRTNRQD